MPLTALPGNVRFRALQLGVQTTLGTPVAATRRLPWRFTPTIDPHWTTPDVDTGTLDPAQAPYRTAIDVTGQSVGPLAANDAQILWAALLKGGVTPTVTSGRDTWQFSPSSVAQDAFEIFTGEWGDETADVFQMEGGVLDSLQLQYPQDLGPIMTTGTWRFASVVYPGTLTAALPVDPLPTWLYGADTRLYIDDAAGSIGISPILNTMHDASITITNNLDVKRFSNGSNTRFNAAGYGRGARLMETTFNLAKTAAALAETAKWLNATAQQRFLALDTTGPIISGGVPYSQRIRWAGYWFTRTEGAVGSNSTAQLVCHHVYNPSLTAPIDVRLINTAATLAQTN